jgi:hypothetical protein
MEHKTASKLMLITGMLFGLIFFGWVGTTVVRHVFNLISTEDLYKGEWKEHTFGNPPMKLKLPFSLNSNYIDIPPLIHKLVAHMNTYSYEAGTNFMMMVNTVRYVPDIDADLRGAANGSIEQLKSMPEIYNVQYEEQPLYVEGKAAIRQDGSLVQQQNENMFVNIIIVDGNNLWQLTMMYPIGDEHGKLLIEEILSSISFL